MCGRFFRHRPRDEIAAAFAARAIGEETLPASYNVPPGQAILVVRHNPRTGERTLENLLWGLIPHFAEDRKIAWRLTNARAETVDRLPSYRGAFEKRRCLVPVDGFYEWATIGRAKQPYAFTLASRETFAIAGLWENWKDPASGEWIRSCTLITTDANALVAPVHDRMPVVLEPKDYASWLGEEPQHPEQLKALLRPFDAEKMRAWPVTPRLNKPGGEDDASLLEPVEVNTGRGDGGAGA